MIPPGTVFVILLEILSYMTTGLFAEKTGSHYIVTPFL
jgi:hypothetical protein